MKKILIVAHDAGAGNILGAYASQSEGAVEMDFVVQGPSEKIFRDRFPDFEKRALKELPENFSRYHRIYTGTSWDSDLERRALERAHFQKVRTITTLDYPTNVRKRFVSADGSMFLPTELWIFEERARAVVNQEIPEIQKILIVPNPFTEEILKRVSRLETRRDHSKGKRILFLDQPLADSALKLHGDSEAYGYTETEAFQKILEALSPLDSGIEEIRIRLHPREATENRNKYKACIESQSGNLQVTYSTTSDLAEDLAWADWVLGLDTPAMMTAQLANKRVYCCIPENILTLSDYPSLFEGKIYNG